MLVVGVAFWPRLVRQCPPANSRRSNLLCAPETRDQRIRKILLTKWCASLKGSTSTTEAELKTLQTQLRGLSWRRTARPSLRRKTTYARKATKHVLARLIKARSRDRRLRRQLLAGRLHMVGSHQRTAASHLHTGESHPRTTLSHLHMVVA